MIGTDRRPMACWAINNHGFQCHARSTHLVARGKVTVDSCSQHLAKVISHVGQASGQSWLAPMIVTVVTIPRGES